MLTELSTVGTYNGDNSPPAAIAAAIMGLKV